MAAVSPGVNLAEPTPLLAVLVGSAVPYTRLGSRSGIAKRPVDGCLDIDINGLRGDEQGDLRVHGGPDKALHHYPRDHYAAWRSELPARAVLDAPGAFGENFSTLGWTEQTVCIGDVVQAGTAMLAVSQGRQPCWKLNDRFELPDMASRLQASGRTGWYYRVLEPGQVRAGDSLRLLERRHPGWPLSRLLEMLYQRMLDRELLEEAATLPLPGSWMRMIQSRLRTASVEAWDKRLDGPPRGEAAGP
jgi:MOSC domain-containing protein YiiM